MISVLKKITRHLKNSKGDVYIEALIALMGLIAVFAFLVQVSTAMVEKMYIDNKLTSISKIVSMNGGWIDPDTGAVRNDIQKIQDDMTAKLGDGGSIIYTTEKTYSSRPDGSSFGPDGFVQIGDTVTINYLHPDYEVLNILDGKLEIKIDIDISKTAVGEIYHKGLE